MAQDQHRRNKPPVKGVTPAGDMHSSGPMTTSAISKAPSKGVTSAGPIRNTVPMARPLAPKPMPVVQSKDNRNVKSSRP